MRSILLIRRIQTDEQWQEDCNNIAEEVFNAFHLSIPCQEYKNTFTKLMAQHIETSEHDADLNALLHDARSDAMGEIYDITSDMDEENEDFNPHFTLKKLINDCVKNYYSSQKPELIDNLKDLLQQEKCIIVYPITFLCGILNRFFNSKDYEVFYSHYNNDEDCIKQTISQAIKDSNYKIASINPQ